ncbi:MAG: DUF3696 domain-containing protein [Candidatus Contendobacter sp.]
MITAFTVKNFKAIGDDPVRIELKPITLLFGANSAGKSSILHALHYAYEVFNNHNLNVEKITMGENNSLDLGGFRRFVHGNDINRSVVLKFELDFAFNSNDLKDSSDRLPSVANPLKLLSNATTAYVEVEISWSYVACLPYVSRYETGINSERIAAIHAVDDGKEGNQVTINHFNMAHRIFSDFWIDYGSTLDCLVEKYVDPRSYIRKSVNQEQEKAQEDECKTPENRRQLFDRFGRVPASAFVLSSNTDNFNIRLYSQGDALPYNWKYIAFDDVWRDTIIINNILEHDIEAELLSSNLRDLLNLILVVPGKHVAEFLEKMCYLGPLREIPSRNYDGNNSDFQSKHIQSRRWATGLGAWDTLYSIGQIQFYELYKSVPSPDDNWRIQRDNYGGHGMPPSTDVFDQPIKYLEKNDGIDTLNIINDWLDRRLNTGYRLFIKRYRELPTNIFTALSESESLEGVYELINDIRHLQEKIRIWLEDSRGLELTPHEIGIGISQVLPVVVAAVGVDARLVAIEQPELHVHPAVQVQLGDLFITQSSKHKFFIIETHSEHLLLRLLRRIRETAEWQAPEEVKILPSEVAVYYVESENGITQANRIGLDENGRFTDRWPRGFFEEREKEYFGELEDLSDKLGRLFEK